MKNPKQRDCAMCRDAVCSMTKVGECDWIDSSKQSIETLL